jgi:hypothetical protein
MKILISVLMLCTSLVSAATGQNTSSSSQSRYTPVVHWNGTPVECDSRANATFPLAYLQGRDNWYGKQLRATGQRSLCHDLKEADEVYRLTWIPSFHHTIMVRVEKRGATHTLRAVRLSGAGGYEPGRSQVDTTILLSQADWDAWIHLATSARFWEASTTESDSVIGPDGKVQIMVGADGAQWLLEARRGTQYHAVDRWSPHAEPYMAFRHACEWLLKRSGLADSAVVAEY